MHKKRNKSWEKETIDTVSDKTLLIVGFGDIGAQCAKVAKFGFGTHVVGVKRNPENVSQEHKEFVHEMVAMSDIDLWLGKADFVLNLLPSTGQTK